MPLRDARLLILVATLGLMHCAGPTQAVVDGSQAPHLGPTWFAHRAAELKISVADAESRDTGLPEDEPPDEAVFDRGLAVEAAALWQTLCASCHGAQGKLQNVPKQEPEPRRWGSMGARMGFFFGGDKMRAGIYRTIRDGRTHEDGRTTMPGWGAVLSREQIWGLVRHIEGF